MDPTSFETAREQGLKPFAEEACHVPGTNFLTVTCDSDIITPEFCLFNGVKARMPKVSLVVAIGNRPIDFFGLLLSIAYR